MTAPIAHTGASMPAALVPLGDAAVWELVDEAVEELEAVGDAVCDGEDMVVN